MQITQKQNSTTEMTTEHTEIKPDYGNIAKGAAVTGAISGVAVGITGTISDASVETNSKAGDEKTGWRYSGKRRLSARGLA